MKPLPPRPPVRRQPGRGAGARPAPSAPTRPWEAFFAGARGRPVDPKLVLEESRSRLRFLGVGLGLFLVAAAARATMVMTIADERLEARAKEQFQASVEIKGRRGDLLDRRGRVVAMEVRLPTLYANPSKFFRHDADDSYTLKVEELDAAITAITAVTGDEPAALRQRFLVTVNGRPRQEVKLGSKLDPAAVKQLTAGYTIDVLWSKDEPVRVWPGRELASTLVGFVGEGDMRAGLERVLNRELEGDRYRMMRDRDRLGRRVEAGVDDARLANAGRSVQLTIDLAIQHQVELALQHAMTVSAPEAAMAVVMDVDTGAILAMASLPAGNPNDGAARADTVMFKNRAAMDQIEPGSVFKPFVAAAALEEGLVTADTLIDCELGHWAIDDRVIKDDHPKGVISVRDVIKYSSNIGAAKLAFKLGNHKLMRYLKDFGFGRESGLKLPGESRGTLRNPDKAQRIEIATTAFGQGVTASPVQLVSALATLANGGTRMSPRLVDALIGIDGNEEEPREPVVDRQVISEDTARVITEMMVTVTDEGGTGTRARVRGYHVAGKTGTAQKVDGKGYSDTKRIASFGGFLPAEQPEVAIVVVLDSPTLGSKYGGIAAGPVFSEIGGWIMQYLAIPPDPSVAGPEIAPGAAPLAPTPDVFTGTAEPLPELELAAAEDGSWVLPDLQGQGIRAVLATLGPAGIPVRFEGSGHVASQTPAAGTHVVPGSEVVVALD